ncbi:MAG: pyridoxamine 5'-phosphate oxidase [Pseudomonadota bacterium]
MVPDQSLPDALPAEPLDTVKGWLAEAIRRADQPNPNAMVLASCDSQGHPSARIVLCKDIDAGAGTLRFFTNYESRKGRELLANPNAALVMHWDHLHRQVRVEGIVQKVSAAESDRYFATRSRDSQLGARASAQSQPVASRAALRAQLDAVIQQFPGDDPVPRPDRWGGFVLWAHTVELWVEGAARLHDRARWTRAVRVTDDGTPHCGAWSATRLQP